MDWTANGLTTVVQHELLDGHGLVCRWKRDCGERFPSDVVGGGRASGGRGSVTLIACFECAGPHYDARESLFIFSSGPYSQRLTPRSLHRSERQSSHVVFTLPRLHTTNCSFWSQQTQLVRDPREPQGAQRVLRDPRQEHPGVPRAAAQLQRRHAHAAAHCRFCRQCLFNLMRCGARR